MKKTLLSILLSGLGMITTTLNADVYDDFSSGKLDKSRWEIRQDIEGQPLMDTGLVIEKNGNHVFNTAQNFPEDRRTYLVPKYTFKLGDMLEYDVNVVSSSGNYGNLVLLSGGDYKRIGMVGFNNGEQPFDEKGWSHMSLSFLEKGLDTKRISPTGDLYTELIPLNHLDSEYELYIGSFTGHNGTTTIEYDNFKINSTNIPEPSTAMLFTFGALAFLLNKKRHKND